MLQLSFPRPPLSLPVGGELDAVADGGEDPALCLSEVVGDAQQRFCQNSDNTAKSSGIGGP